MIRPLIICSILVLLAGHIMCQREVATSKTEKPAFDSIPSIVSITPGINEASGIADSKINSGYLWVQEDGSNPTELQLLRHNGVVQKKIYIKGVTNRDWEDMALSGGHIYIGEIGDNNAVYPEYAIYKFPEPAMNLDTVQAVETIRFRYPDGSHDAEAFLIEPYTNAIYIITKRDNPSRIYRLSPPFSSAVQVAELLGQLNYTGVVGAAISPDGKEIILKTYFALHHYTVSGGEKIEAALLKNPTAIPYQPEPQGEAVCFSINNNGYFTLSEKGFGGDVKLYFYKRN